VSSLTSYEKIRNGKKMQLNGVSVVDRHNRPTVIQKVALRAFFINDGEYYDPADISGVTIFKKAANISPSSILDGNVVASSISTDIIKMHFAASTHEYTGGALSEGEYNPLNLSSLSGVFRVKTGEYVCVLDGDVQVGTQPQFGLYTFYSDINNNESTLIANDATSVDDYIDVWTLKFNNGSDYQSLINNFHLYDDTFFSVTQPVLLTTENRLVNKHLTLSSIENLKITTTVNIQNRDLDESIINLFKDSVITGAMVRVDKVNEGSVTLPAHVPVSGYSDTSATVDITADNTIVWRFDTTTLATHPNVANFGGLTGTYMVTAKYSLLNETIITVPYYFTIS